MVTEISTLAELDSIRNDLTGSYKLVDDIDASETRTSSWNNGNGFEPIGSSSNPFTGTIDGNGYKITGLALSWTQQGTALVSHVDNDGTIQNLTLEDAVLIVQDATWRDPYGLLTGYLKHGSISNCDVSGVIVDPDGNDVLGGGVGGVAGIAESTSRDTESTITDCDANVSIINAYGSAGGIVGYLQGYSTASGCNADTDISAKYMSGGGFAYVRENAIAENCVVDVSLTGIPWSGSSATGDQLGGFCGSVIDGGTARDSRVVGSVEGVSANSGGFTGKINNGEIRRCYSDVDITASADNYMNGVGGFAGKCPSQSSEVNTVDQCVSTGDVTVDCPDSTNNWYAAGFVGVLQGTTVTDCYVANATVSTNVGGNNIAGFAADISTASISNSYAATDLVEMGDPDNVTRNAFIGHVNADTSFTGCYWDAELSGLDEPSTLTDGVSGVTGLQTSEMTGDTAIDKMESLVFAGGPWAAQQGTYPLLESVGRLLTIESLNDLRQVRPSLNYKVVDDIDASPSADEPLEPVGDSTMPYSGIFRGQGYIINGLNVLDDEDAALFGQVSGAHIQNVHLRDVYIEGDGRAGGLATIAEQSVIAACSVSGHVTSESTTAPAGGLVAKTQTGGQITLSWVEDATILGDGDVGGIVGTLEGAIVSSCYVDRDASVEWSGNEGGYGGVGAFAGTISSRVNKSWSTGECEYATFAGTNTGTIVGCYFNDDLSSPQFTSQDGDADITGLSADQMTGSAASDNMAALEFVNDGTRNRDIWVQQAEEFPMLSLFAEATQLYSAKVTDVDGEPVEGAAIETPLGWLRTNVNGYAEFPGPFEPFDVTGLAGTLTKEADPNNPDALSFQFGGLEVSLTDPGTGEALEGVLLEIDDNYAKTDAAGKVRLERLPLDTYEVVAFDTYTVTATISYEGELEKIDFADEFPESGADEPEYEDLTIILIDVIDPAGNRIDSAEAEVDIFGYRNESNEDGRIALPLPTTADLEPTLIFAREDHRYRTRRVEVDPTDPTIGELILEPETQSTNI